MAPGWFFFGLRLKVEYIRLEIIKKNNPSDCAACLKETLVCWLNQNPNAGQLVKALEENKKLLKHIKHSLSQGDHRKELPPVTAGNTLEISLRNFYCNSPQLGGTTTWPPTLKVEYINLKLISQDQISSAKHQKKIAELVKQGELGAALNQSEELALEDIANYPSPRKVIIIEGVPGIGKTTLAYKLCRDWANRKLLTDFWLVVYIPLRDRIMRVTESVNDLLRYFGDSSPEGPEFIKRSQGKGVLFVLDGWDELQMSCRLPDSFFPKLVQGKFLPQSSVVITSRPGAFDWDIRQHANRLIDILGFTEEQVMQYIQSYFKQCEGAAQKLIDELQTYPNIASTCYVAINLTILCYVYLASDFHLPLTLTEVYEQFVLHAIKRHFKRLALIDDPNKINIEGVIGVRAVAGFDESVTRVLKGLGKLALEGIECGDLSFTRRRVTDACLLNDTEEFDGFGLLKVLLLFQIHGTERSYHFIHLTVQEYLAAYTVFQMDEQQQGAWLGKNLTNNSCEKVIKFFCGMDRFKSRPAKVLFIHATTPFELECVFEGQWEDFCQKIAEKMCNKLSITHMRHVEPYQALVYGYVMTKSKTQWHLQWSNCIVEEHVLKGMSRHLLQFPTALTRISMTRSTFATHKAVVLFSELIQSQVELFEFSVTGVKLDEDSFSVICKALENKPTLKAIDLSKNGLSERSSAEHIASLLPKLPSLRALDVSNNHLGEDGCRIILQAAANSTSLEKLCLPKPQSDSLSVYIGELNAKRKEKDLVVY
jgi:hypothetical protein